MKNLLNPIISITKTKVQTSSVDVRLNQADFAEDKPALHNTVIKNNKPENIINPPFYDELHFANYE